MFCYVIEEFAGKSCGEVEATSGGSGGGGDFSSGAGCLSCKAFPPHQFRNVLMSVLDFMRIAFIDAFVRSWMGNILNSKSRQ